MSHEFGLIQIKFRSQMSLVELSLTEQRYDYNKVHSFKSTKKMWDTLAISYEVMS